MESEDRILRNSDDPVGLWLSLKIQDALAALQADEVVVGVFGSDQSGIIIVSLGVEFPGLIRGFRLGPELHGCGILNSVEELDSLAVEILLDSVAEHQALSWVAERGQKAGEEIRAHHGECREMEGFRGLKISLLAASSWDGGDI